MDLLDFIDRIDIRGLTGKHGVEGHIIPKQNKITLLIDNELTVDGIDAIIELRDKLSDAINQFALATGTGFE